MTAALHFIMAVKNIAIVFENGISISFQPFKPSMVRELLGGVPYETKRQNGKVILRFYPKSPDAKNPDGIVFMLALNKEDVSKLKKIIS